MGLDQYCIAKYKECEANNLTGACGGLIPLAPTSKGTEIGYWRKFYKLDDVIRDMKGFSDEQWERKNFKEIPLSKKECEQILSYAQEEKYELEEWWHNDLDRLMESDDGWDYSDWSKTEQIMKKALELIGEKKAKIYYKYWA